MKRTYLMAQTAGGGGEIEYFLKNKVISLFILALSLSSLSALCVGHSIKELYAKLDMIVNGKTVLTYSETLCGPGYSKLIFCGMKKGGNLGSTLSV